MTPFSWRQGSRTLTISLHTMHKLSISEVSKSLTSAAISSRNNGLLEVLLSDGGSLPPSRVPLSLPELMSSAELELHWTAKFVRPEAGRGLGARGGWPHRWPREYKLTWSSCSCCESFSLFIGCWRYILCVVRCLLWERPFQNVFAGMYDIASFPGLFKYYFAERL